jgi:hypothetical protein
LTVPKFWSGWIKRQIHLSWHPKWVPSVDGLAHLAASLL